MVGVELSNGCYYYGRINFRQRQWTLKAYTPVYINKYIVNDVMLTLNIIHRNK